MSGAAYGCLFDKGGVYIASVDQDELPPWEFGFLDVEGNVVDQLVTKLEQARFAEDNTAEVVEALTMLGDLFDVARASALNTDSIVSSLLALLSSDSPASIASHQLPLRETNARSERPRGTGPVEPSSYAFDEEPF